METYLVTAFILVAIGVLLLTFEFFLPTGGIMIVAGVLLFAAAIAVIFYYGTRTEAIVSIVALCIGLPAAGMGMFHAWKRFALTRGLNPDEAGGSVTSAMPELSELDKLKGRFGKTATMMRPSGTVVFDGKRVDALSEGVMLDANVWVRCVEVKAGRVIVRQVDAPNELNELKLEDFQ
jgi:membrane-bound serine protease (ClpP class)